MATSKGCSLQVRPPGITAMWAPALLMCFCTVVSLWAAIASKIRRDFFLKKPPRLVCPGLHHLCVHPALFIADNNNSSWQRFYRHGYPFKNNHGFEFSSCSSAGQNNGEVGSFVTHGVNRDCFHSFLSH